MQMHYLQKQILDQLRTQASARYAELQPDGVESSHFKYHLNILIADGLVSHPSRGTYTLAEKGKSFVDKLSAGRVSPYDTPKVITYTLLSDETHHYLYLKDKEPYRGLLNFIGGKLHTGETATQASQRELWEKLGIDHADPELIGVANIRITRNHEPFTHAVAYLCRVVTTAPIKHPNIVAIAKSESHIQTNLAPDFRELLEMFSSAGQIVRDITIELNQS